MKYLARYGFWLHLLGWVVFIFLPFLVFPFSTFNENPHFKGLFLTKLMEDGLLIVFFYLNLQIFTPILLTKKKVIPFLGALTLGLLACLLIPELLLRFFVFEPSPILPPPQPMGNMNMPNMAVPPPPNNMIFPHQISTFLSFSFVALVSSMLALVRDRLREREEKQQIQIEKVAAELAVLKLQISPHFLFNTLNNIRWLTRQKSDKAEDAVVKLSQLLRYVIYQSHQEKVPLSQEISHLQHYIDLQKMRLNEKDHVTFICEGAIEKYQIEPLLFIPFVENAFKYGLHSQHKSEIVVGMRVSENTLLFFAENPIFENNLPKEGESGVGIQNVKRRLALHYPHRHVLQIENKQTIFRVELLLQLNA
jgi:hypothetical protein